MELRLKNKKVLVTGGSHGIGKQIALSFAKEGCQVAICSRSENKLSAALQEIKQYNQSAISLTCDVLEKSNVDQVISSITERWGGVHILVNNVGGGGRWGKYDILETDEEVWSSVYNKNTFAAVRFTVGFLPYMLKQKWGRVVAVSSISGLQIHERPWFGIAKNSEIYLMKSLARRKEYARSGITFNTIAPGAIMVKGTGWDNERQEDPEKFKIRIDKDYPMGRLGSPEEVSNIVVFLCSEKASLLNGSCIVADGGESVFIS